MVTDLLRELDLTERIALALYAIMVTLCICAVAFLVLGWALLVILCCSGAVALAVTIMVIVYIDNMNLDKQYDASEQKVINALLMTPEERREMARRRKREV